MPASLGDVTEVEANGDDAGRRGWKLLGNQIRTQRSGFLVGIVAGIVWTAAKVAI
ncbi:MAG: hypothetical protein JST73_03170, partial [Actinobacteria bacterium]|nr:hypothetical protein [Actinomycetota bacterium]